MNSKIQSTSFSTLTGRDGDVITSCYFSGNKLYLGVFDLGLVTCTVNRDGSLQSLTMLPLHMIGKIFGNSSGKLLLYIHRQIFTYDARKRLIQLLFKIGHGGPISFSKDRFYSLRERSRGTIEVYSSTGRLLSSFETNASLLTRIFVNSLHIFVFVECQYATITRVYSNDGHFSLIKTIEGQAMYLDDQYLYCEQLINYYSEEVRINLISLQSLEMTSFAVINDLGHIFGVALLGSNKILVKTDFNVHLFELQHEERRLKHVWKFRDRIEPFRVGRGNPYGGLFVLDTSNTMLCLNVQLDCVQTIRISD